MEDQVEYSTVVFKNGHPPPAANKEEQTIYSEVKVQPMSTASASNTADGKKFKPMKEVHVLTAVIVALCVLLLVSIAVLIYLAVSNTSQSSEIQRLSTEVNLLQNDTVHLQDQRDRLQQEGRRLQGQNSELENQTQTLSREKIGLMNLTQDLSRQRDSLNWTLQIIMSFSQFPVSSFCPNKQCKPCLSGWDLFQNKCYLFYDQDPWQTWSQSQTYCKQNNPISDLVVIDSLEEQKFIHDHISYYYDKFHGFWIGLTNDTGTWVWVNGQTNTLGFWMKTALGDSGPKALIIPGQNVTTSWDPADGNMNNKFICESKALIIV